MNEIIKFEAVTMVQEVKSTDSWNDLAINRGNTLLVTPTPHINVYSDQLRREKLVRDSASELSIRDLYPSMKIREFCYIVQQKRQKGRG